MWKYNYTTELYHYGVLGMRWGKRKAKYGTTTSQKVASKKSALESARNKMIDAAYEKRMRNNDYTKKFDDALKLKNQFGKNNENSNKRLADAMDASNAADSAYKQARQEYKLAKKDYKNENRKVNKNLTQNFADKFIFNNATTKQINNYLNKGETLKSAKTKTYIQAGVNTAAAILAIVGTAKLGDKLFK